MSQPAGGALPYAAQPPAPPPPDQPPSTWLPSWLAGLIVGGALAVLGAVLGLVWESWSPPGPLGYVISPGAVQADETEAFVAADGRFAVLAIVVGILAGLAVWSYRPARGSIAVLSLAVGGLAGALLTNAVGHAVRGGRGDGKANTLLAHLPLQVHMHGLLLLEAAVAVLVYVLCVAFARDDDLGRPDPRAERRAAAAVPVSAPAPATGSVGMGDQLQHPGRDADAPGGLQQRDLPAQQRDSEL